MPHVYIITDVINSFVHLTICHSFFIGPIWHHIRLKNTKYRKTSNIRRTIVGNQIVDHSDAVGASPVGAALITSSFST